MTDLARSRRYRRSNMARGTPLPRMATMLGCLAILLWSTLATLTGLKGPAVPPFQTTAITFAIAGIIILVIAATRGRLAAVMPAGPSFALATTALFGYHALYFAALKLAPAAEASLIASLWALLIVLLAPLLPGHHLLGRHLSGAMLGLGAAAVLVWGDDRAGVSSDARMWGYAMALGCAVLWAGYSVLSRLIAKVPSEALALPCLATATLATICNQLFEGWIAPPDAASWSALVLLGIGPVGGAFVLWDVGMKHGNISQLGVLAYASPVISTGLLVAVGQAQPKLSLAIACALMMLAAWIAVRRE